MSFAKYVTRVETMYCVTDRLHSGRTVRVPGPEIAPTVAAWLAELGAHSPLVEDLSRAACGVRRAPVTGRRPMPSATDYPLMCSLQARRSFQRITNIDRGTKSFWTGDVVLSCGRCDYAIVGITSFLKGPIAMNARFPDAGTIRTVLALASRAPSVHNTQPWRWLVGAESLHLYSDADRQLPNTDPDGRDLILSCGAALNHCVVAFAAVGWRAKVNRLPNPADPTHLAAIELSRSTADPVNIALAAAIPRRRTDRRHYSSWQVPVGDIGVMAARAARNGVTLCEVEDTDKLHKIVTQSVWDHMTHDYLVELTEWSGRYASVAGVPARNTPKSDPKAKIPSRLFAGPALAMPSGSSPAEDNAVVLALGTRDDDRLAQLRAGEATSIVLLTATSMGLASCPVTEPLEIAETREAVRAEIFGSSNYPQMLLRVGWAPINADPLPSTPRRELSEFVEWVADREQIGEWTEFQEFSAGVWTADAARCATASTEPELGLGRAQSGKSWHDDR